MNTTSHTCPPDHPHDNNCYLHHRCRDVRCKASRAADARTRRREQAYGTYTRGMVDVVPVREHVAWLRSHGMGPATIAAASGVSFSTLGAIIWSRRASQAGQRQRPQRVAAVTAQRLLAVRPELDLLAEHALIDATGYRRRLQALMAHGWTLPAIADASAGEATAHQLRPWLRATQITAGSARVIVRIFDRLQLATPPRRTAQQRAMSQRAQRLAGRNRWAPALAWDDIDTDPAVPAVPATVADGAGVEPVDDIAVELALAGRGVRLTPGERRACVPVLHAKRWSDEAIAEQLHCASKTVERIRNELGLPAWSYAELEVTRAAA